MTADTLLTALVVSRYPPDGALLGACGADRAFILDQRGAGNWIGAI
jgi:hypothetical protein